MDPNKTYRFVALLGSLRQGSYNAMVLRAAQAVAPANIQIEVLEGLGELPAYNQDVQGQGFPAGLEAMAQKIRAADGVLIVSPEYNYSVPGFLKNALDWLSRHPSKPFEGQAVGIMGASPGLLGTARAQYHLRQILVFLNAYPVNRPEIMIGQAADKFTPEGELKDEKTREFIGQLLTAVASLHDKMGGSAPAVK